MSDFDNSCGLELILPDSLREAFHRIDRTVAKAMKQVKEPFSLDELFEKIDINKKIGLLRAASFEMGWKIGTADYSDMSDKIDDVISLEKRSRCCCWTGRRKPNCYRKSLRKLKS